MKKFLTIENFFCLVIFSLPLYQIRSDIFGLPTNVSELLAAAAALFLFVRKRNVLLEKFRALPKMISYATTLILAGILLSILTNDAYLVGLGILKGWFVVPIFFSFALYTLVDLEKIIEKIFLSLYLSAALVGLIGVVYKLSGSVTYDGRLSAFYLSPNHLAMYLAPGIFFGTYFLLKSFLQKRFSKYFFLHLALSAPILVSLYLTYSYGAWLAVLVSVFATLFFILPGKKYALAGVFIAIVTAVFVLQTDSPKFTSLAQLSQRSSFASRIAIWKASLLMIEKNPVLGIGPGNFQTEYLALQKHFPPYLEWAVPQPHNIFLAFWLQAGFLGLSGFLLLLFFVFKSLVKIMRNKSGAFLAAPLFGFFLYTFLHGLADTPYWKNDLAFLFWICVFLTVSLKDICHCEEQQRRGNP